MESAAINAAMYIWVLFGTSIDGMTVRFNFLPNFENAPAWQGLVVTSSEIEMFAFTMNAATGEMISIRNIYSTADNSNITWEDIYNAGPFEPVNVLAPEKEYGQAIERFVRIMTKGGQAVNTTFRFANPVAFERDENGNVTATNFNMYFNVDSIPAGRERTRDVLGSADISVDFNTGELVWVFVQP
jgi:hypothetical protein